MDIGALEKLLHGTRDTPMLRLTLGRLYAEQGDWSQAIEHLQQAVDRDPDYSAAWKALGQAQQRHGRLRDAEDSFQSGMAAARRRGDKQLERECAVYHKRVLKALAGDGSG